MFGFQMDGWLEVSGVLPSSSLHTGLTSSFPGHYRQTQTQTPRHCPLHAQRLFATPLRESSAQGACQISAFSSHLESETANTLNSLDADLRFLIPKV